MLLCLSLNLFTFFKLFFPFNSHWIIPGSCFPNLWLFDQCLFSLLCFSVQKFSLHSLSNVSFLKFYFLSDLSIFVIIHKSWSDIGNIFAISVLTTTDSFLIWFGIFLVFLFHGNVCLFS